ncbi:hypothetical protein [Amycolatopsis tolypomycina]|uniref:hypothetical protein n=1 Tax=Amycolatopsis tolypomycina TaxID=208445 RepID=UPI0033AB058E
MTGELVVGGAAGGVGTSTWVRLMRWNTRTPVRDLGMPYRGGPLHVLVTATTAAANLNLGAALKACPRPPLLVVMQTVPFKAAADARALFRAAEPHIAGRFDVGFRKAWLEMSEPPGRRYPSRDSELIATISAFFTAMQQQLRTPQPLHPSPGVAQPVRHAPPRAIAAARTQTWRPASGAPPQIIRHAGPPGRP